MNIISFKETDDPYKYNYNYNQWPSIYNTSHSVPMFEQGTFFSINSPPFTDVHSV